ncbi:translationally controlled tumor-associated [Nadsonia fulvescens var. elongata DSM 6958]|uniref:Translationally-controlled tumor protein homolog n=1 Tax=Nadsonia fulvescens var. elongata DSM 6958 TaxID=857566 RepID=A0A1E3PEW7_9ASCO|nr:translationally controlled tumor-associated [Nadsonia fulvescens var. elongata DSM 6958]
MLIYNDIITQDEMISDAYDMTLVDDVVYEVDCQMITIKEGDVDIGGNPSAEDAEDELEEGAVQVNNVAHSFRLQETSFDKKSFLTYIKGYMKAVKAKLADTDPEQIPIFEKGAMAYVKKVVANFKDYDFFTGESMDPDGMIVLLNYREDGTTPFCIFWKHGLKAQKV